jgi:hypothetical protein
MRRSGERSLRHERSCYDIISYSGWYGSSSDGINRQRGLKPYRQQHNNRVNKQMSSNEDGSTAIGDGSRSSHSVQSLRMHWV